MKQSSVGLHDEAQVLRCVHNDIRGALNLYRRAYLAAEEEGDRFLTVHNQVHAADCLVRLGDLETAAQELVSTFAREDELPVHDEMADACASLIDIQLEIPTELPRIRRMIQRLELQEDAHSVGGGRRLRGSSLLRRASIAELQGRWSDALALTLEALARQDDEQRASSLLRLASQCTQLGHFDQATVYLADWERLERAPQPREGLHREDRVGFLLAKSDLARAQGRSEEALCHADAAASLADEADDESNVEAAQLAVLRAALSCRRIAPARTGAIALLSRRRAQSLLTRYRVYSALGDFHVGSLLVQLGVQPPDYELREDEVTAVRRLASQRAWRLYSRAAKLARTLDDRLETDRYGRAVRRRIAWLHPL